MRARPACPTLSGNHRQRAADFAGLEHPASPRPYGTRARCRPGRREHWQTGTRSDRTSVPGGGGILACSPHDRGHACRGARVHSSEKPRARASIEPRCQVERRVPPPGNMRGAPSRAASSEGAGARCGGDAATATRSLDIATESSGMRRQGIIGRARRQQTGSPGLGAPGTTTNQPTGAYGGGGGFR